jgi:kynurenine 3-monooxygenase
VTQAVLDNGVSNADYVITRAYPDKRGAQVSKPLLAVKAAENAIWIPRARLLEVLSDAASSAGADVRTGCIVDQIRLPETGAGVDSDERATVRVRPASGSGSSTTTRTGSGSSTVYAPRLLLACDGIDSCVRRALEEAEADGDRRFRPVRLSSPSAGLNYKMLQVPATFAIHNLSRGSLSRGGGVVRTPKSDAGRARADESELVWTESRAAYTLPGAPAPRRRRLRLGLLPSRDGTIPRTANIIRPPTHEIWKVRSAEELRRYLSETFPQVVDIDRFVDEGEAAGFVAATPGVFPACSFVPTLSRVAGGTGVALLGDAAHAFPPDVGQGVNAALEDVSSLVDALDGAGALEPPALADGRTLAHAIAEAMEDYNAKRAPAAEALARIVRIAFPFQ